MSMPRKDLALHKLNGTQPAYVEPASVAEPGRPKFPKDLSPAARKVFKRICSLLEQRRALTTGDSELVRLYCILFDRHARSMVHVNVEGEIVVLVRLDSNGKAHDMLKENPWLRVAKDAEKQMVAILDRLGLTPANRGKIKPTEAPKPTEEHDPRLTREPAPDTTPADPLDEFDGIDLEAIQ